MCVCVYMYECVYICIYTYIYIYIYICICMYLCMYVCIHTHTRNPKAIMSADVSSNRHG